MLFATLQCGETGRLRAGQLFVVLLIVDAEDALVTNPSLALRLQELPDSLFPDALQVFNLAHAVFRAVAMVEVPEAVAGELQAMATERAASFVANAQAAVDAGFGLVQFGIIAAVARIVFAQERSANPAIHPARGDKIPGDPVWHLTLVPFRRMTGYATLERQIVPGQTGSLGIRELHSQSPESRILVDFRVRLRAPI